MLLLAQRAGVEVITREHSRGLTHRYLVITPSQVGSAMASETVALLRGLMGCEGKQSVVGST